LRRTRWFVGAVVGFARVAAASDLAPPAAVHATTEPIAPVAPVPPALESPESPATARSIVLWPTLTPAGDSAGQVLVRKPSASDGLIAARAEELDATLRDAAQDFGFVLNVSDPGPAKGRTRDSDILERAARSDATDRGTWVVSPRLEATGNDAYYMRIAVVAPRGDEVHVKAIDVQGDDVSARGLVLMRQLIESSLEHPKVSTHATPQPECASSPPSPPVHSEGRGVLAANAALFGAFIAYSVQRASDSEDPRLLYPLLTLGTGFGLGGALLVADEWDIRSASAWTLSGGAWWGTAAGLAIASGRPSLPASDRYAWGVGGGLIGLSVATASLAFARTPVTDGDATLVNSSSALGFGLGALGEWFHRGATTGPAPSSGAGYGTAAGLLIGSALAHAVDLTPTRVMLIDLGAGLGAAAGAAGASPLVFENITEQKSRAFLGVTALGAIAGAGTAWLLTREPRSGRSSHAGESSLVRPFGGIIGASATAHGDAPALGAGVRGLW